MFDDVQQTIVELYGMDYNAEPSAAFLEKCAQAHAAGMQAWEFVSVFTRLRKELQGVEVQARERALLAEMRRQYRVHRDSNIGIRK